MNEIAESRDLLNLVNEFKCSLKIMICDDDSSVRISLKRIINKCGEEKRIFVDIEETINGLECLFKVYNDYLMGNKYDLVFLDENMPFMKGSICSNILKNMYFEGQMNKIKLISISSFEDQEIQKFLKQQGFDDFLQKPHSRETISKFFQNFLSQWNDWLIN